MSTVLIGSNLAKSYGRQVVLEGVTFDVSDRARIALIGRNGAGKTTLLRIIAGEEEPDSGLVNLVGGARIGVLRQNERMPCDVATLQYLEDTTGEPEWECRKLGASFGLGDGELSLAPSELSGGYQMRIKLVRMLLAKPEVLLLDEPVNYLDLPTLILLESFLKLFRGALIITSHDREVLQNLCSTTWEVEWGRLNIFSGDPETYLDWKDEQAEYARRTNKKLRREVAHAQEFVDRFRSKASLATRAQSKMKYIAKLRNRMREMESDLPTTAFRIPCAPFVDGEAVRTAELSIGYDGQSISSGINISIKRGAKVAVVGENGRGKTTLLKTIAGELAPIGGSFKWWHRANIGYFAQHAEEALPSDQTVLQVLNSAAKAEASAERILGVAGAFLFRDDDLEKKISMLSGGERARVRLASLVLQDHNVLLLDEPTNHLDAETVEVLAGALSEYEGTVILVSHARTFVNAVAERIYEVRPGSVRLYHGTYEEYVAELQEMAADGDGQSVGAATVAEAKLARQEARLKDRERQRDMARLEKKLGEFDKERSKILKFFFENPLDYSPERQTRLSELEDEIQKAESDWMKLSE